MRQIINVQTLDEYRLKLTFDNNVIKVKDMKPYLNKGVFKELKDKKKFDSVKINFGTICWDGEIDMCADYLYETSEEIK